MQGYDQLGADGADRLLARSPRAVLATLRAGGAPHLVPVVFAGDSRALWFAVDGKPKRGRELQRIRHITRDSRVAMLVDHYDDDWQRLWWLRLDGSARLLARDCPRGAMALGLLTDKYPQYRQVSLGTADSPLVEVTVGTIRAWCAGTWSEALQP